jgi:Fe-S-cluster-containing hydrogenase component 2
MRRRSMVDQLEVPMSGVVAFESKICTGCGTCELICSSRRTGVNNPQLSCISIYSDGLGGEPRHDVCNQCHFPSCLYACPVDAILVDQATGARYIDDENCVNCGSCYEACPFTPERAMIKTWVEDGEQKFFKCDLCKDRPEGPMCVQYCPTMALMYIDAKSRAQGERKEGDTSQDAIGGVLRKDFFKPESEKQRTD